MVGGARAARPPPARRGRAQYGAARDFHRAEAPRPRALRTWNNVDKL
jgi:hypothetical protein